ncbi:MAG TPA: hypothetical protein PL072_10000 [Phycisphaerales bacterium]|nr:hypothetical protein [Phycisphaerales bacterium]
MNEQTKTIIDRARELLAAATPGPVTAYPHPRPCQDHDESRFQWGDLVTGGRSMWTMIPMADAEALAFAVNNIRTLCDAVVDAERRVAEAEARDAHNRSEVERVIGPTLAAMKRAGIDPLPDATDELLRRLDTAEARVAELRDRAGIAEGREAAAKANAEEMAGWLDARNAGLVQMARERDALRAEVEALKAQRDVARQDARRAENERDALRDEAGPRLTVAQIQRESYDTACAKGWHDEDETPPSPIRGIA